MQDKLDILIALVAKDCGNEEVEQMKSLDTSGVVFSRRFYRKKARMIAKYKHYKERMVWKQALIRVAVAIMALMSLAFMTVMAVEPLREAIFQVVVEWYDDYLTIRYEKPDGNTPGGDTSASTQEEGTSAYESESSGGLTEESQSSTPQPDEDGTVAVTPETPPPENVVTPPTTIEEVRKPTYIPEGVVEDVVLENNTNVIVDYYRGDDWVYSFMQELWTESDIGINNEGASLEYIMVNEHEAVFITLDDASEKFIVWNDGEYMYRLTFLAGSMEEMVAVAKSVSAQAA